MKFVRGVKDYFKIVKSRFIGLRKEIRFLLFLSFVSILLIEFGLKKIQPRFQFQADFGVIYLNLCYSYFSAFIFYYLIIFMPMERRRINTLRYVNNKLLTIGNLISGILETLFNEVNPTLAAPSKFTQKDIDNICHQINPKSPISLHFSENATFSDHYAYINFKTSKIKLLSSELIILNDLLDEELIRGLTNINDAITSFLTFDNNIPSNNDMQYLSVSLHNLYFESNEMLSHFSNNYNRRYNLQYHKNERERNKKRKGVQS